MKKVYKIITFLFILFILTSCSKVKVYFDYNCGVDRGYTCNIVNSKRCSGYGIELIFKRILALLTEKNNYYYEKDI